MRNYSDFLNRISHSEQKNKMIAEDFQERFLQNYKQEWINTYHHPLRVLSASIFMFFASGLPAIAFWRISQPVYSSNLWNSARACIDWIMWSNIFFNIWTASHYCG
jgi:hypothetical protein